MASGDLDGSNLQCSLIDAEVDLASDATFRAPMLARMPLAFTLDLHPCAVDQQIQRPLGAALGNVHGQRLVAPAPRAEVRDRSVETDQAQQALNKVGRLP